MIKFRNFEFENLKICPLTAIVFDEKTGKEYCSKIKKGERISYIPYPVKKFFKTHHLMAYTYLNKKFEEDTVVHHIDGNHLNNVLSNLKVIDRKAHSALHNSNLTPERREKLSLACTGRIPWNKGKKMSEEYCENNRKAQLKYWAEHKRSKKGELKNDRQ